MWHGCAITWLYYSFPCLVVAPSPACLPCLSATHGSNNMPLSVGGIRKEERKEEGRRRKEKENVIPCILFLSVCHGMASSLGRKEERGGKGREKEERNVRGKYHGGGGGGRKEGRAVGGRRHPSSSSISEKNVAQHGMAWQ